jgi:hypothetical protein
MKTIRNLVTLAGFSVVFLALGATGAKAQSLRTPHFSGTFTLPFNAQWGRTILPAGEYKLYYGRLFEGGPAMVEVVGKENRTPHALILPQSVSDASATKSALVCVREGGAGIIRALEMPQIGEAVNFSMPRGTQLMAHRQNGSKNIELAQGPMLIQRIAITLAQK